MEPQRRPLIIAHRGFSGRYPENTVTAVRAALRLGVDMVEVDVQETRDGQLVVFHDNWLTRIYGVRKRVCDALRRELPAAPTLADVLRACRGRAKVLVEIKQASGAKVAREIARCRMEQNVIVFSFDPARLDELAAENPKLVRFGLVARGRWRGGPVEGIGLARQQVTSPAVVRRLQRRGLRVFVWTVNRPSDMRRLAAWGVDGLITDWPDRARQAWLDIAGESPQKLHPHDHD